VGYDGDEDAFDPGDDAHELERPADAGVRDARSDGATLLRDGGIDPAEELGCGIAEVCTPDCESGTCDVRCAGALLCDTHVAEDAYAAIDCNDAQLCNLHCNAGATCDVDCRGANDCDNLECQDGASCTLRCGNNLLGCSLDCQGVAMNCANDVQVCDAPCP
jgi:hypothetical protein